MDPDVEHRKRSYVLFASLAGVAGALVFAVRLASGPVAPFEVLTLGTLVAMTALGLGRVRAGADAEPWSLALLGFLSAAAVVGHATIPTSRFTPEMLGAVVVFGSLTLRPRWFSWFCLALLGAAIGSRGIRIHLGLGGDQPTMALANLLIGYLAFGPALLALDRQHRGAAERLRAARLEAVQVRDAALHAAEAKQRFLANMSHELRTPLNAILGYSELLGEEVADAGADEDATDILQRVHHEGRSLLDHLDAVLEAARGEASSEGEGSLREGEASGLLHAPSDLEALGRVDRAFVGWRGAVTTGLACIAVIGAQAVVSELLGQPTEWAIVGATSLLGAVVASLGWWRRPLAASLVLVVGGSLVLGWTIATVPDAPGMAPYVFILCAFAALLLRPRPLAATLAVVVGAAAVGFAGRYAATGDANGSALPLIAVALVATSLLAMGHRRQAHRDELLAAATAAERARRQAEASELARTQFLSQMSLEVRTPLTSIAGYGELLLEELPPEHHEDLQRIVRASSHLRRVVDDVLDMASLAHGRHASEAQRFDLRKVCDDALDLARTALASCTVTVVVPPTPLWARADRTRTSQIVVNLLSNAGKYASGTEVQLSATASGDLLRVEVRDQGPGIPADDVDRLFQPFERVDPRAEIGGSGLGLAIARHLARAQGGELAADTELGRGSTFTLTVPADPTLAAPLGRSAPAAAAR